MNNYQVGSLHVLCSLTWESLVRSAISLAASLDAADGTASRAAAADGTVRCAAAADGTVRCAVQHFVKRRK